MDRKTQSNYENKLSDWMAIDAIVRQRDKEITAANIAKLSGKYFRILLKYQLRYYKKNSFLLIFCVFCTFCI